MSMVAGEVDDILVLYKGLQEESRGWGVDATACGGDAERDSSPVLARFSIGPNDFPEEAISSSGVSFLLSTLTKVDRTLRSPLPEVADWPSACLELTRRYALGLARIYLVWTAFFLACDKRFNPKSPVALNATDIFDGDANDFSLRLECLAKVTAYICPILDERFPCTFLAGELRILQLAAATFFDVLENVFGLPSVGECRIGFDRLMQAFGTEGAVELVPNFLRRHRTMQQEICDAKSVSRPADDPTGGTSLRKLEVLGEAILKVANNNNAGIAQSLKFSAKLDRQMREFLATLKTMIGGFIRSFRPGLPPPTREKLSAALLPPERYACLARVKEPHRSQIKAVIDYTWNGHPVAFNSKSRSAYTLSNAVADVWRMNAKKWTKAPGTFATERDLRSACYNIAEKADGGVSFNFRR